MRTFTAVMLICGAILVLHGGFGTCAASEQSTWLVMLYLDADDEILEQDIFTDLNEAELVGSSDAVRIVCQLDRYAGGFDGDGDWTTTKRFLLETDRDLFALNSPVVKDMGEANMADGAALVNFVTWAIESYPAERYVLIMSDHGSGWPGGWYDDDPIPGDRLWLVELDEALEEIRVRTGIERFELIGFDACLMGHLEVFNAVAPHARYAVASQETEPSIGWAYAAFLEELAGDPGMGGASLAESIVSSYLDQDQILVNDNARALFVMQQFYELTPQEKQAIAHMDSQEMKALIEEYGIPNAGELAPLLGGEAATLAAVDLAALQGVNEALDDFVVTLAGIDQAVVAQARTYAQSFESVFGEDVPASYIDLRHFAAVLSVESGNSDVQAGADVLSSAIDRAVIAERHGTARSGASGVSIYFPNAALYTRPESGPAEYAAVASRFAAVSQWDDFLAFHYAGDLVDTLEEAAAAIGTLEIVAPGAGWIEINPILAEDVALAPGEITSLETEIRGEQIGFIYLFVGLYYEEYDSILIADTDFVDAESKLVGGVHYPDWGEDEAVPLFFNWEANLWGLNDGVTSDFVMFAPESFGATEGPATYSVEGFYTSVDTGESRDALVFFEGGELTRVLGFFGEGDVGAPRQIQVKPGDTFTVVHQWIDIIDPDEGVVEYSTSDGTTFVFGSQPFTWEILPAFEGSYLVGFMVEDLEGTLFEEYTWIDVVEDEAALWSEGTLFRDNFTWEDSGWWVSEDEYGETFYYEGTYGIWQAPADSFTFSWAPSAEGFPADFAVEVDAAQSFGPDDGSYGIVWGPADDNFYWFEVSADGWYTLSRMRNGEWEEPIVNWTESPEINLGDTPNQLRVSVYGDEIYLYINGILIETLTGPNLGPGRVGLIGAAYEEPDVEVWFDNFQVWRLE